MEETYEQIKKMIADGFVEEAVAAARESMGGDTTPSYFISWATLT